LHVKVRGLHVEVRARGASGVSEGPRIPLDVADQMSSWLIERLGSDLGLEVVGSVRRRRPEVGDLELLAPVGDEALDKRLRETMVFSREKEGDLFQAPPPSPLGTVVRGGQPRWRACSIDLWLQQRQCSFRLEIYRYDPGPQGNYGWIKMIRTGPSEFGRWILGRWMVERGNSRATASANGYPLDRVGTPVACPTEDRAFTLAGVPFVPPEERDGYVGGGRERESAYRSGNLRTGAGSETFEAFHEAHPEIFQHFRMLAEDVLESGFTRYSADAICQRIRWHYQVERGDLDFDLNDHFTSRYARLLMDSDDRFRGFF